MLNLHSFWGCGRIEYLYWHRQYSIWKHFDLEYQHFCFGSVHKIELNEFMNETETMIFCVILFERRICIECAWNYTD